MRAIDYALRRAWASTWRRRSSSAFAIAAIALAMIVLGSLLLLTWNAEQLLARWTTASELSVYLRDDATSEQRGTIEALIDGSGLAEGRDYVSKAQALARFRREFSELAALTDAFDDNPFPASVEVRLRDGAEGGGQVEPLIARVAKSPGVADVRYDREWIARLGEALRTFRRAGLVLAALMALAAAVTVASVVRLGLQARSDEIEIMELVGAPFTFIRGPFVAEGVLQGGIGALLAVILLGAGFLAVRAWWGDSLASMLSGALVFLPLRTCALLIVGGMMVGALGGLVASRHAGRAPAATGPAAAGAAADR